MAVKRILQLGDPRLKQKTIAINGFADPKLKQIVQDLEDTMIKNGLVGIAAPQIGSNLKILITEPHKTPYRPVDQTDQLRVYINPQIIRSSKEEIIFYEGCGCVAEAKLFGPVKRPKEITIEAFDISGRKFRLTTDGLLGRVIQHEYDHLFGIEFTERITDYAKLIHAKFYKKFIRFTKEQTEASIITKKEFRFV